MRTLFLVCLMSTLAAAPSKAPVEPDYIRILEEVHSSLGRLAPNEHATLLLRLAKTISPVSAERSRTWADECFRSAKYESVDNKGAYEKNAIVLISAFDPEAAYSRFLEQELPDPKSSEDYRTYAAEDLFPRMYAKTESASLTKIGSAAAWLGQTGAYPYQAMAKLLPKVAESDQQGAKLLYANAIRAFRTDLAYTDYFAAYVSFVLETQKVPDRTALLDAVDNALKLADSPAQTDREKELKTVFEIRTAQGTTTLSSDAERELFRLLPLLNELDPERARGVKEKYPALGYSYLPVDGESPVTAGVAIRKTNQSPAQIQHAMDRNKLMQVNEVAPQDSSRALAIANSISDPDQRDLAYASVISSSPDLQASDTDSKLDALKKSAESMSNSSTRLKLQVALVKAFTSRGRYDEARIYADKSFSTAEELFQEDRLSNPTKSLYSVKGFDELSELATTMAKGDLAADDLGRIRNIENRLLQCNLLISYADGRVHALHKSDTSAAAAVK